MRTRRLDVDVRHGAASGVDRGERSPSRPRPIEAAEALQRGLGNRLVGAIIRGVPASGSPVESRVRRRVEAITGADCRDVRVHLDGDAQAATAAIGARACTVGRNIYFGAGEYRPHTTDGARLIAHELIHTIQQGGAGRLQAKPRLGAPGDVHEQEADAIAEVAVASGARGPTHPVRGRVGGDVVVQRKVFVDGKRATFHPANPASPDEHPLDGPLQQVGAAWNIAQMVADRRSRFFVDEAELLAYANGTTTEIGYVDREKTWVRLNPDRPLVLGENHAHTTLRDLVEATKHRNYLYEGGRIAGDPQDVDRAIEPRLPVRAVGLIGVEQLLNAKIVEIKATYAACTGFDKSAWKAAHDLERAQVPQPQAVQADEFALWNAKWEDDHPNPQARYDHHFNYDNSTMGITYPSPPDRNYDRAGQEAGLTRKVLAYLSDDADVKTDALSKFYRDHKEIVDTTLQELGQGRPLVHTRMFRKMVTGKFDFTKLRELMEAAAEAAFKAAGVEDLSGGQRYEGRIETAEAGRRMEALRDSYMLDNIVKACANGVRLFGLGDFHRQNISNRLKQKIADIDIQSSDTFYRLQYQKHRDRD